MRLAEVKNSGRYNERVNYFIQSTVEAWLTNQDLNNQFQRKLTVGLIKRSKLFCNQSAFTLLTANRKTLESEQVTSDRKREGGRVKQR